MFNRKEHVYKSEHFAELVKDAVRFFNGTPVHNLPLEESFLGSGVYAIYYTGNNTFYSKLSEINRLSYSLPIYVGKAVPDGWRQGRISDTSLNQSNKLFSRIREHTKNIELGEALSIDDFSCRFVIFEESGSDMISTIEAALIKLFKPVWNTTVDGFGNHDPGRGRYNQAKSDWDVIHPGRKFARKCLGKANSKTIIINRINDHFNAS